MKKRLQGTLRENSGDQHNRFCAASVLHTGLEHNFAMFDFAQHRNVIVQNVFAHASGDNKGVT